MIHALLIPIDRFEFLDQRHDGPVEITRFLGQVCRCLMQPFMSHGGAPSLLSSLDERIDCAFSRGISTACSHAGSRGILIQIRSQQIALQRQPEQIEAAIRFAGRRIRQLNPSPGGNLLES
jgi:hypothetical protein